MSYPQGLSLILYGLIFHLIDKKAISRIFCYILEMKIGSGFEQKGLERPRWAIDVVPFHCSVLFVDFFFQGQFFKCSFQRSTAPFVPTLPQNPFKNKNTHFLLIYSKS